MALSRRQFLTSTAQLGMAFSAGAVLPGCASSTSNHSVTPAQSQAPLVTDIQASSDDQTPSVLVAYFSQTGTTERVGEMIAQALDADVFVIEPKDAYTSDDVNWRDETSRVCQEMPHRSEMDVELVETVPPSFEDYDTVFVGYPIWWQSFSWVLNNFVRTNDFEGKTVIPFCTSMSSPLGESATELAAEAANGDWQPGMRFSSSTTEQDVADWLESLGLNGSSAAQ